MRRSAWVLGGLAAAFLIIGESGMAGTWAAAWAAAQEDIIKIEEQDIAGEFFGQPVPIGNYRFAKAAILVFGSQWGGEPKTPQELEDRVWEDLLLSFEAYKRGVMVPAEELDKELDAVLKSEKVTFDRKSDRSAYEAWIRERVKEPVEAFENQLKHLIQLKKLRQQVMESMEPPVSEEEAYQEYLNEYNTLGVELVQFDDEAAARGFYLKMKNPKLWEKEAKKNPKFAVRPGFVSLECLMDLWKIPREDVYAMLELPVNSVYAPTPIYRGYGVFRTLEKRVAEKDKFEPVRASYFEQVKMKKRYDGYNDWLKQLKAEAGIKVYLPRTQKATLVRAWMNGLRAGFHPTGGRPKQKGPRALARGVPPSAAPMAQDAAQPEAGA